MRVYALLLSTATALSLGACGSKQPADQTTDVPDDTASSTAEERQAAVEEGKRQIQSWISDDLALRITTSGKNHGALIGEKLARNPAVTDKAKSLSTAVLKDPMVAPKLDAIKDKATAGFSKQLTLGWKALKAGGIDAFKSKVSGDAARVGVEVLSRHLKEDLLKDPRMLAMLKSFSPVLKIQGRIAAIALQEKLSPRVTQKIVSISLRIAAAGNNAEMAARVGAWLATCKGDLSDRIDHLMTDVAALQSLEDALGALAFEVLAHPRTTQEMAAMIAALLEDPAVNERLIKVYEAAAFEKGDGAIRGAMDDVVRLDVVDKTLFDTLNRLSAAPGAGEIVGRHLRTIGEDPSLAAIVEDFVLSVLDTCGDPGAAREI